MTHRSTAEVALSLATSEREFMAAAQGYAFAGQTLRSHPEDQEVRAIALEERILYLNKANSCLDDYLDLVHEIGSVTTKSVQEETVRSDT